MYNKLIITLFFLSTLFIHSNIHAILVSDDLLEFKNCFAIKAQDSENLKKINLEYDSTYYGAILLDFNRKLENKLDTYDLIELYEEYAINEKYIKFIGFYESFISESKLLNDHLLYLRKGYEFLELIKNTKEMEIFVKDLYRDDFWLKNEGAFVYMVDFCSKNILKNNIQKYSNCIEPVTDIRAEMIRKYMNKLNNIDL